MNNSRSFSEFLNSVVKSMRVWQWPKNLIVFTIPLGIASTDFFLYQRIFYAFFGISLLASSVYFFNDINDIELDRTHPLKKDRPIASGEISLQLAYLISMTLAIVGGSILAQLSNATFALGAAYLFINVTYTYKLKYIKFLDVLSISIMFVIRVLIGSYAIMTPASSYLLGFIFFASSGLALSKRISVLNDSQVQTDTEYRTVLNGLYSSTNLVSLLTINSSLSVITFILWIGGVKDVEILSLESIFFGFTAFLMVLILRKILKLSTRGLLEDFVVGVIKDKSLLYQIVFSLILLILGLYV